MSDLTETEIKDCLKSNLKLAADQCDLIAAHPQSGPQFDRMRKALRLVEGACRQMAYWRQDARWLIPGRKMEDAHQIARKWLHRPTISSKKLFIGLAAALRKMLADIDRLETARTGRAGMILPTPLIGQGSHVTPRQHVVKTPGGIILPG